MGTRGSSANLERVTAAINEVAKSLKAIIFYPEKHPSLKRILEKTLETIENIPIPEEGIEIEISKNDLTFLEMKIPEKHVAVPDLRNSLFVRRTKKLIFLPGQELEDLKSFLKAISLDPEEILRDGGLEDVLIERRVSRIWVNRVDYEKLTEELKKEKEQPELPDENIILEDEPLELGEELLAAPIDFIMGEQALDEKSIDQLLSELASTTGLSQYRDLVVRISGMIRQMSSDRRLRYSEDAIKIYTRHIQYPPGGEEEIKSTAINGIKEIADEEVIDTYVMKFRMRAIQDKVEAEIVLSVIGNIAVERVLIALTEEKDLIVRKAMVDLVTKIGVDATDSILEYLDDDRWYVVRNMITILGGMGLDEAAPHIAITLQNPDPRVKKEAIKALSKIPSPVAITSLGECCFLPDENIVRLAITALGTKKDEKAVEILHERFLTKKLVFPDFNLSREVIDSLKNIGTENAVDVLKHISLYNPIFKTRRVKELKAYAIKALGKIKSEASDSTLEELSRSSDTTCRDTASKILKRRGYGQD